MGKAFPAARWERCVRPRHRLCSLQHALRLAAFGHLHKVLGMDPLPSKMPKKPKNENPVDYTGT